MSKAKVVKKVTLAIKKIKKGQAAVVESLKKQKPEQ